MNEEIDYSVESDISFNSNTYVLLICLFLVFIYINRKQSHLQSGGLTPVNSLVGLLSKMFNIFIILILILGIFTFPVLFYAGLLFYVLQNYMFAFMKKI